MLTRLEVRGFKNLADVDVRFGPFTCVAGANGAGKSNLFDALQLLSLLAERPLEEAARAVRGGAGGAETLLCRLGGEPAAHLTLAAEMIVPPRGVDDYGQEAAATSTFLRYELTLARRSDGRRTATPDGAGALAVVEETLTHVPEGEAHRHLPFEHSAARWRESVVASRRRAPYFISTEDRPAGRSVVLHQDGEPLGAPRAFEAARLPRTVLSGASAAESPTALLAREEMRGWRLLQPEPSALREPDALTAPGRLGPRGAHLAATLHRLAHAGDRPPEEVYAEVGSTLAALCDDVAAVRVERDEERRLLTVRVRARDGSDHPAAALSDGSLRLLALAVLAADRGGWRLLALEEPENGVHPGRLGAMLALLQEAAVDPEQPVDESNPLRQVIVNTHSPAAVARVPADSLLVAAAGPGGAAGFHPLPGTWRDGLPGGAPPVTAGALRDYLDPVSLDALRRERELRRSPRPRVAERDDLAPRLPFPEPVE